MPARFAMAALTLQIAGGLLAIASALVSIDGLIHARLSPYASLSILIICFIAGLILLAAGQMWRVRLNVERKSRESRGALEEALRDAKQREADES